MPTPSKMPPIPAASPASRLVPGKSRERVARELGMSVAEVERIERVALAKAYREMQRRGLSYLDLISLIQTPT